MKKTQIGALLLIVALVCHAALAQADALVYSNLDSEASRLVVASAMKGAGIEQEKVDTILAWVRDFNDCMRGCTSFALVGDFITVDGLLVDYGDYLPMSTTWFKENRRDYADILCRVAAFALNGQNIEVADALPRESWSCWDEETDWLVSDWGCISENPILHWDEAEIERYFTLFNPIAISGDLDSDQMTEAISAEWAKRGVSFGSEDYSLLTLWIQSGSEIVAAHAATLLGARDGYLLFEKTNPQSPYAATRFASPGEAKAYMVEMLRFDDARYGIETGDWVVMQDDRPL